MVVDFLIIGVQKGGTKGATRNLLSHPEIWMPTKEPHFYDKDERWNQGLNWYSKLIRAKHPPQKHVFGESTPKLIACKKSLLRVKEVVPSAKLIVLLRNPTDRVISSWQMETRDNIRKKLRCWTLNNRVWNWPKNLTLESWLPPLRRGHYAEQLQHLYSLFPKEQVHVAISERVISNMHQGYNRMVGFLGLDEYKPPSAIANQTKKPEPVSVEDWQRINDYYKPYNEQLFEFLGEEIPEWEHSKYSPA